MMSDYTRVRISSFIKKGFRVVAIEALGELCEIAWQRSQKYVETGQLVILSFAISNENGPIKFAKSTAQRVGKY